MEFHAFANNTELALELRLNSISSSSSSSAYENTSTNNVPQDKPSDHPLAVVPCLTLALSDDSYGGAGAGAGSSLISIINASVKKERDQVASEEESADRGVVENTSCEEDIDEDGAGVNNGCRKKLRLTKSQSGLLEEAFKLHPTLNPKQKQELARDLKLRPRQVEVWFQNRRARTKLKQTEVDCEYLRKCCKTLTDENQRLQREVQELKAQKVMSKPLYTQLPAATLTICPSCEQVVDTNSATTKSPFTMATNKPYFFNPFTSSSAAC